MMIIKFKAKTIKLGRSLGVIIPASYFKNELLKLHKEYEFNVYDKDDIDTQDEGIDK